MAQAQKDPNYRGHIVNTASMAGLLTPPNMGIYNTSKHAVVSLTETLYQDLRQVTDQISASVLCPYFVPTGIHQSERNRPSHLAAAQPTASQLIGQAMSDKAVTSGKVTAEQVAQMVFDAVRVNQFYIYSHPKALGNARIRFQVEGLNPAGARAALTEGLASPQISVVEPLSLSFLTTTNLYKCSKVNDCIILTINSIGVQNILVNEFITNINTTVNTIKTNNIVTHQL